MEFLYTNQQLSESCFLLCNGLGGYCSMTGAFSAPRADQGILVAAVKAPNERITLVHRLQEVLHTEGNSCFLSGQAFADGTQAEDGCSYAEVFQHDTLPLWRYAAGNVRVTRQCVMGWEENTVGILYRLENRASTPCTLEVTPFFKFAPKETALEMPKPLTYANGTVSADGYTLHIRTGGALREIRPQWQWLAYPEDAKDGRPDRGLAGSCCAISFTVPGNAVQELEILFSTQAEAASVHRLAEAHAARMAELEAKLSFTDPAARQLAISADAYIARRDSTGGKTILAGYPLFSDWGRDTMIALPGCTLATGRYEDARSILRTFLAYEKDGLVPNLFPEGEAQPMYNTVDAALLLIDSVWQYLLRTDDWNFVREAFPVLQRIIACYRRGTHHCIGMDEDGLIFAGKGLDQVTWMDVCVQGVLPTPRHGKPVEINAYWYNALKIMEALAPRMGADGSEYGRLAQRVKTSFTEKFYMEDRGYLKDVLSGTDADTQLRCNQVWALSMPFTMLSPEQEQRVLDAVTRHLLNSCGLRTLSPQDGQYHGHYGGSQYHRDMAYHQGTTWVFPMGAYYLSYLRIHGNTKAAAADVKQQLTKLIPMLRQGCAGQLPEIYDGDNPYEGKGCFAQAWSVGEMLRVYEAIETIERRKA